MILPKARTENIVVQGTGDELLVYDLLSHQAYNLNRTSRLVFEACDGRTSFDELKRRYQFTDDLIYLTLDELKGHGLILSDYRSGLTNMSRREAIRRVGLTTMMALPLITTITAPPAARAQSIVQVSCLAQCSSSAQCPANCGTCRQGFGSCSVAGGGACFNIGGPCSVTGICQSFGVAGICSEGNGLCSNVGGPCTHTGTCQGVGVFRCDT